MNKKTFILATLFSLLSFIIVSCSRGSINPYIDDDYRSKLGFKIDEYVYRQLVEKLLPNEFMFADGGLNSNADSIEIRAFLTGEPYPPIYDLSNLYIRLPLCPESGEFKPGEESIVVFYVGDVTYYSVPETISYRYTYIGEKRVKGEFSMRVLLASCYTREPAFVQTYDGVFSLILYNHVEGKYGSGFNEPYMVSVKRGKRERYIWPE